MLNNFNKNKGLTLVEMLVSVAIFSIVSLAFLGVILYLFGVEKGTKKTKIAIDNINFALENISRDLKTGQEYKCSIDGTSYTSSCPNDSYDYLGLKETDTLKEVFYWKGENSGVGAIYRKEQGSNPVPITSSDVNIKNIVFYLKGAKSFSSEPDGPPRIKIIIEAETTYKNKIISLNLETFVTQRKIDVY